MAEPEQSPRQALSVLGHPVVGLAPITFLSAGWIVLAFYVFPWLRDQYAGAFLAGERFAPLRSLSPPASLLLLGALAGGLLFVGLVMVYVWVRSAGGLGPLSDRMLRRNEVLAGLVLLGSGVLTCALLSRGEPSYGEAGAHIARGWLWHDSIRGGTFPRWTDLWFGGHTADAYSPPLPHLLQALIGFLRFDPSSAAKELAWFSRMAGGMGFALFSARIHRDLRSGLLGGILYALAPTFHATWIWHGDLASALLLGMLPWALYAAERLATGAGRMRSGAAFALLGGGLVLANTDQARSAAVLLGVLIVVRIVPTLATRGARAPSVAGILVGTLGGGALAAGFLYPVLRDAPLLNATPFDDLFRIGLRIPDLAGIRDSLRWNPLGDGYKGISIAVLALAGLARAALDRSKESRAVGSLGLFLLLLLPWCLVVPWRSDLGLILLGAQIAAPALVRRPPRPARRAWLQRGIFPLAMLLLLVDLGPGNLITTYGVRPDPGREIYSRLRAPIGGGRFLHLSADADGRIAPSHRLHAIGAPIPSVGGPSVEGTPRAFSFQAALIDTVARAMETRRPFPRDLVRLLAVHNVRYIVVTGPEGPLTPRSLEGEGVALNPDLPALRVEEAAPVAVLEPGAPPGPPEPDEVVGPEGLPTSAADRLARASIGWVRAARPRTVAEARAVVLPNRLEIETPDLGPVTIRIARNAYPETEVRVDGRAWPWRKGPLGGIVIDLEKGSHKIEVRATEDRIRRACRLGQWGLMALLLLVAIGPYRR
ncbi:MAG: hypothetical protein FJY88_08280 [Candidatus Eisenbacteria bacterium]|nr:hypothetical protein [Candidatus Eisenbacteria bacterium]